MSRQTRFQTLFGSARRRSSSSGARPTAKRPGADRARRLVMERLEERAMLSATTNFELSSLLPANGGNVSSGFVVNGIFDNGGGLGAPLLGYQALGDVNADGTDDFFLAARGLGGNPNSQSYLIFGRAGGFPAELDLHTLDGTNGYVLDATAISNNTGYYGSGVGDVNHDGFPDFAIGAHVASPSPDRLNAGQTLVVFGGPNHLAAFDLVDTVTDGHIDLSNLDGTNGFVINGIAADDDLGAVSAAGDFNGDGVGDLVLGAGGAGQSGAAYVVFGQDSTTGNYFPAALELTTLNGPNGFTIPGLPLVTSGSTLGTAVGGGGDINGDGISDIILGDAFGDPTYPRTDAGQAYVIFGQTSFSAPTFDLASLNGSNGFKINGKANVDWTAQHVAGIAGDVNGDGVDDVMLSTYLLDGPAGADVGGSYIIFGKTTATAGAFPAVLEVSALNGSDGFVMYGATAGDHAKFGSAAGDVNGDGYDDVLIGAGDADPNGITNAGQSYIVYGRSNFGASFQLSSLLAVNGGDGSLGYALFGSNPTAPDYQSHYVAGLGDVNHDGYADVGIGGRPSADTNGLTNNGQVFIVYGKPSLAPTTKFYVVNDATSDRTYEYGAAGATVENYALTAGNTAPRGAASTIAGDKTWVVDANRKVYVYNASGGLLGSWTAGTLANNAVVEGIATNGTDVWIVDAKSDKVFKYAGAATRLSGSQNAASSFSLNSSNTSPKDIVTDGASLWVVNDSTTDKVFKYSTSGSLLGSWTISTSGASSPTGITVYPANPSDIWIVDSGSDKVYQYMAAASLTTGIRAADATFALAAGNTNPQGIADPPAPGTIQPESVQVAAASQASALDLAMGQWLGDSTRSPLRDLRPLRAAQLARPAVPTALQRPLTVRSTSQSSRGDVELATTGHSSSQAEPWTRLTDEVLAGWNAGGCFGSVQLSEAVGV